MAMEYGYGPPTELAAIIIEKRKKKKEKKETRTWTRLAGECFVNWFEKV